MAHSVPLSTPGYSNDELRSYSALSTAPGPLVSAGDFLRLNATSTDATATLTLNGRLLTMKGEIVPFTMSMPIVAAGDQTAKVTSLTDGWIIGFVVFVSAGTISDGEVVASVEVVQASGAGATRVMCLASGEITNTRELGLGAFTAASASAATAGQALFGQSIASPAVGLGKTIPIPAGMKWQLLSLSGTLACDANVANRLPFLTLTTVAGGAYTVFTGNFILATTTKLFHFSTFPGVGQTLGDIYIVAINPTPTLSGTDTIVLNIDNIQAGDQVSALFINVRQTAV